MVKKGGRENEHGRKGKETEERRKTGERKGRKGMHCGTKQPDVPAPNNPPTQELGSE